MQAFGSVATGSANDRGIPLPTAPPIRRPSLDLVDRIAAKKAHDAALRIPIAPKPATAEHQCRTCKEWVHTVSRRGWCDWCEQQAAAAIAPSDEVPNRQEQAENIPAFIPAGDDVDPYDTDPDGPEPDDDSPIDPDDLDASDEVPERQAPDDDGPVELPDYILDFAILMRDTEGHDDPQIRAARKTTANAAMTLHRVWTQLQRRQMQAAKPKPERKRRPGNGRGRRPIDPAVVDAIVRLYTGPEQLTINAIAERLHIGKRTVRLKLLARGVQLRDDRNRNSGRHDHRRANDPTFGPTAVAKYQAGATIEEVATDLHTGRRQVRDALIAAGVTIRPPVTRPGLTTHGPGVATKRRVDQLRAVGATPADVRAWARGQGIEVGPRGVPAIDVVDAYLTARGQA